MQTKIYVDERNVKCKQQSESEPHMTFNYATKGRRATKKSFFSHVIVEGGKR